MVLLSCLELFQIRVFLSLCGETNDEFVFVPRLGKPDLNDSDKYDLKKTCSKLLYSSEGAMRGEPSQTSCVKKLYFTFIVYTNKSHVTHEKYEKRNNGKKFIAAERTTKLSSDV